MKASGSGYVTKFHVDADFLSRYPVQIVGGHEHTEHWIPAEELEEFNRHILGPITITRTYPESIDASNQKYNSSLAQRYGYLKKEVTLGFDALDRVEYSTQTFAEIFDEMKAELNNPASLMAFAGFFHLTK